MEKYKKLLCGVTEAERFSGACFGSHLFFAKSMICTGFGHRDVFENIIWQIDTAVTSAIEKGCDTFYTGAMGDFDSLFSSAVRKAKKEHPNIKLICIKPYLTADINGDREYYATVYDDILVPDELAGIHYKAAIKARNRWIIDHSDIIIGYSIRNYGGAYTAIRYAEKAGKAIIRISPTAPPISPTV